MATEQETARAQAIARGYDAAEVDAFIAREGGSRTSATRILSAFSSSSLAQPPVRFVDPAAQSMLFGGFSQMDAELIFRAQAPDSGGSDTEVNIDAPAPIQGLMRDVQSGHLLTQIVIAVIAALVVTWLMKGK